MPTPEAGAAALALEFAPLCEGEAGLLWQRLDRAQARGCTLTPALAATIAHRLRVTLHRQRHGRCTVHRIHWLSLQQLQEGGWDPSADVERPGRDVDADAALQATSALAPVLRHIIEETVLRGRLLHDVGRELERDPSRIHQLRRQGLAELRAALAA